MFDWERSSRVIGESELRKLVGSCRLLIVCVRMLFVSKLSMFSCKSWSRRCGGMRYRVKTGPGREEEVVVLPEAETEVDLEEVFGLSTSCVTDSVSTREMGTAGMGERVLG